VYQKSTAAVTLIGGPRRPAKNAKADGALRKLCKEHRGLPNIHAFINELAVRNGTFEKTQFYYLFGGFLSANSILYFVGFILQVKFINIFGKISLRNLRLFFVLP
jgi:hypothetical protein